MGALTGNFSREEQGSIEINFLQGGDDQIIVLSQPSPFGLMSFIKFPEQRLAVSGED
jgi:hypothetical protein